MAGGKSPGSSCTPQLPGAVYEKAVGSCPVTTVKLGGIPVRCLLDSGSQVSTITESFSNQHFHPRGTDLLDTNKWLTLTAANGLEIPYIGYLELDFEAQGVTIPQRGILVVKDPPDPQSRARKEAVPGLLGMNIIQKMNEETKQLEDTAWTSTLQAVAKAATSVRGLARIAGRDNIRIPAGSITTVDATGYRGLLPGEESCILVEPLRDQTHHGLMIASTLTSVHGKHVKVKVANVGQEDVWLRPRERIGTMHAVSGVQEDYQDFDLTQVSVHEVVVHHKDEEAPKHKQSPKSPPLSSPTPSSDRTPEQQAQLDELLVKYKDISK